jgi:hypothetical protein
MNGFVVRRFVGYHRLEGQDAVAAQIDPVQLPSEVRPFESVSSEQRQLWDANPDQTGRELFDSLCRTHLGEFHGGQLRTLRRRLPSPGQ